jgi:hypothetical protein
MCPQSILQELQRIALLLLKRRHCRENALDEATALRTARAEEYLAIDNRLTQGALAVVVRRLHPGTSTNTPKHFSSLRISLAMPAVFFSAYACA